MLYVIVFFFSKEIKNKSGKKKQLLSIKHEKHKKVLSGCLVLCINRWKYPLKRIKSVKNIFCFATYNYKIHEHRSKCLGADMVEGMFPTWAYMDKNIWCEYTWVSISTFSHRSLCNSWALIYQPYLGTDPCAGTVLFIVWYLSIHTCV